jgi:CheY-like chemotaxis protein
MSNEEGLRFLEDLKQSPRTQAIPIVAISACAHPSMTERIESGEVAAFVPKPCSPDVLAVTLRRVLDADRDAGGCPHDPRAA